MLVMYSMVHYLISSYWAIHVLKTIACIGLHHATPVIEESLCTARNPLSINMKHLQNGNCQWQTLTKDELAFPVQDMYLVTACVLNENTVII